MARKKAQRKQETTLVPHGTPNLSGLLERAQSGDSSKAVKAYLDAGGSPAILVQSRKESMQLPLLLSMVITNAHPHRELAESVGLLVAAGADMNARSVDPRGIGLTALLCATGCHCCSAVMDIMLRAGADACECSSLERTTALHYAAQLGLQTGVKCYLQEKALYWR
jgi:ankyrin repeat protein